MSGWGQNGSYASFMANQPNLNPALQQSLPPTSLPPTMYQQQQQQQQQMLQQQQTLAPNVTGFPLMQQPTGMYQQRTPALSMQPTGFVPLQQPQQQHMQMQPQMQFQHQAQQHQQPIIAQQTGFMAPQVTGFTQARPVQNFPLQGQSMAAAQSHLVPPVPALPHQYQQAQPHQQQPQISPQITSFQSVDPRLASMQNSFMRMFFLTSHAGS